MIKQRRDRDKLVLLWHIQHPVFESSSRLEYVRVKSPLIANVLKDGPSRPAHSDCQHCDSARGGDPSIWIEIRTRLKIELAG